MPKANAKSPTVETATGVPGLLPPLGNEDPSCNVPSCPEVKPGDSPPNVATVLDFNPWSCHRGTTAIRTSAFQMKRQIEIGTRERLSGQGDHVNDVLSGRSYRKRRFDIFCSSLRESFVLTVLLANFVPLRMLQYPKISRIYIIEKYEDISFQRRGRASHFTCQSGSVGNVSDGRLYHSTLTLRTPLPQ